MCRYGWLGLREFEREFDSAAPPHDITAQTLAPNESLLRRLRLQTNLFCADSGSKLISTEQTLAPDKSLLRTTQAPNESLLRRLVLQTNLYCAQLRLQTNLYCADSCSKWISTAQTLTPNKSLLCRLWLQANLYCADSDSKQISTVQTLAPNESLLRRLWLQTNLYCADSGSKRISDTQTLAPNDIIYSRWQQPNWDAFTSLFYSGRKRRRIVHLFYSVWFKWMNGRDAGFCLLHTLKCAWCSRWFHHLPSQWGHK